MKTAKLLLTLVVIALVLPAMAWAEPKVIKYAHFQPAKLDQPKQAAALAFKNYVEANTKGSLKVEIYPASQLGGYLRDNIDSYRYICITCKRP